MRLQQDNFVTSCRFCLVVKDSPSKICYPGGNGRPILAPALARVRKEDEAVEFHRLPRAAAEGPDDVAEDAAGLQGLFAQAAVEGHAGQGAPARARPRDADDGRTARVGALADPFGNG